jgi:hypothetical protein
MKGTSVSRPKQFFIPASPPLCSQVPETSHVALTAQALQAGQDWSKSVSNEGHLTLAAEGVFRPCRSSYDSGVIESS